MNIDDVIRQMQEDEKSDQRLITPVDYGRLRGIAPQLVYYHIRAQHLPVELCDCGRRCIVKEDADEYFRSVGKLAPRASEDGEGEDVHGPDAD